MNNIHPYTTNPRFLTQMRREGKLTPNEYLVLIWLRNNADMLGITTTSLGDIRDDLSLTISENTVNKILRALREMHLIDFENRQGKRGSFRIWMGYWLLPKQGYREVPDCTPKSPTPNEPKSEETSSIDEDVSPKTTTPIPNYNEMKNQLLKAYSVPPERTSILNPYNDKDTERDIRTLPDSLRGRTLTRDWEPRTSEERTVKRIALAVDDENVNPMLAILKTFGKERGLFAIEAAYAELQLRENNGLVIKNRPAYLMGIIKYKLQNHA